jgi:protein-export membrane protein SecD
MDKNTKLRLAVILFVLLVSAFYMVPSIRYYSMTEEKRQEMELSQPLDYARLEDDALKLGLDLQGGMHLVLELDQEQVDMGKDEVEDAIDRTLEIIRNRVDQFGVAEPLIQRVGDERIIVELPGLEDEERAKELVRSSAYLEFKIVRGVDKLSEIVQSIDAHLMTIEGNGLPDIAGEDADREEERETVEPSETSLEELLFPETEPEETVSPGSYLLSNLMVTFPVRGGDPDIAVPVENIPALDWIMVREDVASLIPDDVQIHWGPKIFLNDGREFRQIFLLEKESEMTGDLLSTASATFGSGNDPQVANQPIVNLRMTNAGADVFERLTGRNVGERLAIVLDGVVKSAPVIRQRISGGQAQIEGIDSIDEARDLAIILRAGALPAPIKIIEERTIGPTLGSDSIEKSRIAGLVGMAIVLAFVLFYYRFAGILASVALVLDIFLVLAALAGLGATLTLPGIAGLILTIGMAIDANVLIYERIREELETGKSIRAAIDVGYERAFRTILDANVTTFITAMVLLRFGTGPVKGFAVTLSIGIMASMFTAVYVTRTLFNIYIGTRRLKTLSI